MNHNQPNDFAEFLSFFLETCPEVSSKDLAKELVVHKSHVSKLKSGKSAPSPGLVHKMYAFATQFPPFADLDEDALLCLAGRVDDPYKGRLAQHIVEMKKKHPDVGAWIGERQPSGPPPNIAVNAQYPTGTETIRGRVVSGPFVEDKSNELRVTIVIDRDEFEGNRAEVGFENVEEKFSTSVNDRTIVVR